MNELLRVDDLRTTFDTPAGRVVAVDGISLRLDRGATLGIVGESGSGKSVLSRSILRLVDAHHAHVTGDVVLDGHDLASLTSRQLRAVRGRTAAMIFQDPMTALNATMRIGTQLTESLREHLDTDRATRRRMAVELLRSVGIPEPERHLRSYPHQLSGGMRQRAMIAIALACGPELLIADEPTTALDVTMQRQVLDLLADEQQRRGMAMILITHDLGVVAGRADHIVVMYAGRAVERAPARRLFERPSHPYTAGLLRSIPRLSDEPGRELSTIAGSPPVVTVTAGQTGCPFAPRCLLAQSECLSTTPQLVPVDDADAGDADDPDDHLHACLFPLGSARGEAARQRNEDAGITVTGLRVGRREFDLVGAGDEEAVG